MIGAGWIALAIVIFGGWHPLRAALGAYLFASLQVVGITYKSNFQGFRLLSFRWHLSL